MPIKNEDKKDMPELKLVDKSDIIKEYYAIITDPPYGFKPNMKIKPATRWFKFKLKLIKIFMPWKVKNL